MFLYNEFRKRTENGTDLFFFYRNRDLDVILSYNDAGISEHGIYHGITTSPYE